MFNNVDLFFAILALSYRIRIIYLSLILIFIRLKIRYIILVSKITPWLMDIHFQVTQGILDGILNILDRILALLRTRDNNSS